MKYYYINGEPIETNEKCEQIMQDLEHNISIRIYVSQYIDFDIANKIAALGQPLFINGDGFNDNYANVVKDLISNSVESVIVSLYVDNNSIEHVYYVANTIAQDPELWPAQIMFHEEYVDDVDDYLADQDWNKLIVHCIDHNVNLCWQHESAGYHYSTYLKDISE